MTINALQKSWCEISELSKSLLIKNENENLEHIIELAAIRHQKILDHFKSYPVEEFSAEFYIDELEKILTIDAHLTKEIELAKQNIRGKSISLKTQRGAAKAYSFSQ